MKLKIRRLITIIILALLLVTAYFFLPEHPQLAGLETLGEQYAVRILRDTWGVPHVFGTTDSDAAFGLAYAHSEDDFLTIQQIILAARGKLATVYGADAAPNDYMVQLLRVWDVVNAQYEADLEPATRALLTGYADGLNYYAALHPDTVIAPDLFPVTGMDMAAVSVHRSPLFFGLDSTLGALFAEELPSEFATTPIQGGFETPYRLGSNVFAIAPNRTADGSTFLGVNSHQPWTGPVAWYDAHVHSEDGWDMTGALFPGAPVVVHGHNRDLGWGFTVNHPDLTDVYQLEMNPDDPDQYFFDGEWLELESWQAPLEVRLFGRFRWTVKREVLWSVHGPAVRRDEGVYALRYAGFGRVDIFEQLYRLNKATNFDEWQAAMQDGALPMFNVGYADRVGNIYYLYNGLIPQRNPEYNWSGLLPGDTSTTLWTEYLSFEALPQVFNPPVGFIQNANNTPFRTTTGGVNPNPADYAPSLGIDTGMTNRALRMLSLFGADQSITFDEFVGYKYDLAYAPESDVARYVEMLINAPLPDDPDVRAGIELLRVWDLRTDPENTSTALAIFTVYFLDELVPDLDFSALAGVEVELPVLMNAFTRAVRYMMDTHGRLDVPWGEINRLERGAVNLPVGGGPDILHAVYGELREDGRFYGIAGDGHILLASWSPTGQVTSWGIHQFGSATLDPTSPHYADQAPLFARRELKPVWFNEADIRANLEREYRPGEELNPSP